MFEWVKKLKLSDGLKLTEDIISPNQHVECLRDKEVIRNTRNDINQQWEDMQIRAMKPHESTCEDPMTCEKEVCFIREPDKIVKRYYR